MAPLFMIYSEKKSNNYINQLMLETNSKILKAPIVFECKIAYKSKSKLKSFQFFSSNSAICFQLNNLIFLI